MSVTRRDFLKHTLAAAPGLFLGSTLLEGLHSPLLAAPGRAQRSASTAWWAPIVEKPGIEFNNTALRAVYGQIPAGLRGTLFRNGPARLRRGQEVSAHWFDGDGAVLAVDFGPTGAVARYRYVRTPEYTREQGAGRYLYPGYGYKLPGPQALSSIARIKNAANTSVLPLGDRVLALWEGAQPYALDALTLSTLGQDDLGYLASSENYSAHPRVDPATGDIYGFGIEISDTAVAHFYQMSSSGAFKQRGLIPLSYPGIVHDMALAGPYLVIFVPPMTFDAKGGLSGQKSIDECYAWIDGAPTEVIVIDRATLTEKTRFMIDPFFHWHYGNMYVESGGALVLSVIEHTDYRVTDAWLAQIPSGAPTAAGNLSRLVTLRIDPGAGRILSKEQVFDHPCEMPTVNVFDPAQSARDVYVGAFSSLAPQPADLSNSVARVDIQTGAFDLYSAGTQAVMLEPRFVRDAIDPAAGWVLVNTYEGADQSSYLDIFAADRLADGPVCRLAFPYAMPLSFHGAWQPA